MRKPSSGINEMRQLKEKKSSILHFLFYIVIISGVNKGLS